jgi:hypothetical protein
MDATNLNHIAEASAGVSNFWQFLTLVILGIGLPLVSWLSKYWVKKSSALEDEKTKNRKLERDKQINDLKTEINKEIEELKTETHGLGKSFDKHINSHKDKDNFYDSYIKGFDSRLQRIEMNSIERKEFSELQTNIHCMDKNIVKIMTILDERFQKVVS